MSDILLDTTFSQTMVVVAILSMLLLTIGQMLFPIGSPGGTLYRQDILLGSIYISIPSLMVLGYFLYNGFEEDSRLLAIPEFIYLISTTLIIIYVLITTIFNREDVSIIPGVIKIHKTRFTGPLIIILLISGSLSAIHLKQTGLKNVESFDPILTPVTPIPKSKNTEKLVEANSDLNANEKSNNELKMKEERKMSKPLFIYDPRLIDFYQSSQNYVPDTFLEDFLNVRVQEDRQSKLIFGFSIKE